MSRNEALADIVAPIADLELPEQLKLQAAAEIGLHYGLRRTSKDPDHERQAYTALDAVRFLLEDYLRQAEAPKVLDNPTVTDITNRMDRWLATRPANNPRREL